MGRFNCGYCKKDFQSKHSIAKFCSRRCANKTTRNGANQERRYSDLELIDALQRKASELGRSPTKKEMKSPNEKTYRIRFGSWNNALSLADLNQNLLYPLPCFENERIHLSLKLRFKILERDGFVCQYCGGSPNNGYLLHVDHIIPRSKGGKTETDNLITACVLCNLGKSDMGG